MQQSIVMKSRKNNKAKRLKMETFDLLNIMNNLKFYPPHKLVEIYNISIEAFANEPDEAGVRNATYLSIAQKCASDLMPYIYPKRKLVEVNPSEETKKLLEQMSDKEILIIANQLVAEGEEKDGSSSE